MIKKEEVLKPRLGMNAFNAYRNSSTSYKLLT